MGVPIRISNDVYEAAKKVAKAECRSIPNQIEFWAKIGKCALDNPDMPVEFIYDILVAKNQDRSLAETFILKANMSKISVLYMPAFKKIYKKLHVNEKLIVDEVIEEIIKNPKIGEEKKGDLKSVFVYKFKIHRQEMLLAYEWNPKERLLLALGVHENFYRDLKKTFIN